MFAICGPTLCFLLAVLLTAFLALNKASAAVEAVASQRSGSAIYLRHRRGYRPFG